MFTNCLAPSFTQVHEYSAGDPEECHSLFEQAGISLEMYSCYPDFAVAEYNEYLSRVLENPELQTKLYDRYKTMTQVYLRHIKDENIRYVAKSRLHLFFLEPLLEVFPDAKFLITHRSMHNVVPSWTMLLDTVTKEDWKFDHSSPEVARKCAYHLRQLVGKGLENRKKLEQKGHRDKFIDISYNEFIGDPIKEMKKVYKLIDLQWNDECEEKMKIYLEESKKKRQKIGVKKYKLSQFQLTKEFIDSEFKEYNDFLKERNIIV